MQLLHSLIMYFMKPGQEVGAIRTDIPGELIFARLYTTKDSCYE